MSRFIRTAEQISAGPPLDVSSELTELSNAIQQRPTFTCVCTDIFEDQIITGKVLCNAFESRIISSGCLPLAYQNWTLINCCCQWSGSLGCCITFCLADSHLYHEFCIIFRGMCTCCLACSTWTFGPGSLSCCIWSNQSSVCPWVNRTRDFCSCNFGYVNAATVTFCSCSLLCCFLTVGYECAGAVSLNNTAGFDINIGAQEGGYVCSCACPSWFMRTKLWTAAECSLLCKQSDAIWYCPDCFFWPTPTTGSSGKALSKLTVCTTYSICPMGSCTTSGQSYWAIYGRKR